MIRVNLLRNRVVDQTATTVQETEGSSETRDSLVKLAFMLMIPAGLMVLEGQSIQALNAESNRLSVQVSELENQAAAKAQEVESVKDIEVQAKELEDKLKILKLLSRLRLREVKTLDFMQSSIPEKVWLKSIAFEADKVQVEQGRFQFNGLAVATEDLSEFVKRLEDSAYLSEVIIIKNQETQMSGKGGTVREFLFTADVEGKEK